MVTLAHPPRWLTPALGSLVTLLAAILLGILLQNQPDLGAADPLIPRDVDSVSAVPQANWSSIVAAAPFGSDQPARAVETQLPLKLLGVIAETDPQQGQALIASGGSASAVYSVGATLPGGATLLEIYPTHVILQRAGRRESLALPENGLPSLGAAISPAMALGDDSGAVRLPESPRGNAIAQVMTWQSVLRAGQPSGVRVYPGANAAAFEALGLRPGDLVLTVNQAPLTEASGNRDFAALLSSSPTLQLGIEREGRLQTLQIDVNQLTAPPSTAAPPPL